MLQVYSPESGIQIGCPACLWLAPFEPISESDLASIDYVFEIDPDNEEPPAGLNR